jgi:hypothetical protein
MSKDEQEEFDSMLHASFADARREYQRACEARPLHEKLREKLGVIVLFTLISGVLGLQLTDALLQRFHHPVKVPVIGWIGAPVDTNSVDPGDCDPSVQAPC